MRKHQLTPAQQGQQKNRDSEGQYQAKSHSAVDIADDPLGVAISSGVRPDGELDTRNTPIGEGNRVIDIKHGEHDTVYGDGSRSGTEAFDFAHIERNNDGTHTVVAHTTIDIREILDMGGVRHEEAHRYVDDHFDDIRGWVRERYGKTVEIDDASCDSGMFQVMCYAGRMESTPPSECEVRHFALLNSDAATVSRELTPGHKDGAELSRFLYKIDAKRKEDEAEEFFARHR